MSTSIKSKNVLGKNKEIKNKKMNCEEVSNTIYKMIFNELPSERKAIDKHISQCSKCRKNKEDTQTLIKAMDEIEKPKIDENLYLKVVSEIEAEQNKKIKLKLKTFIQKTFYPDKAFVLKQLIPAVCMLLLILAGGYNLNDRIHQSIRLKGKGWIISDISEWIFPQKQKIPLFIKNKSFPFSLVLVVKQIEREKISVSVQSSKKGFLFLFAINSDGRWINIWPDGKKENLIDSYHKYSTAIPLSNFPEDGKVVTILLRKKYPFMNWLQNTENNNKNIISNINAQLKTLETDAWMTAEFEVM